VIDVDYCRITATTGAFWLVRRSDLQTQQASDPFDPAPHHSGAKPSALRPHLVSRDGGIARSPIAKNLTGAQRIASRGIHSAVAPMSSNKEISAAAHSWTIRGVSKRVVDVAGSITIAIVFLPFIVVIAGLLCIDGGPVIYRHRRIGRDGKEFECLKFRSMVTNADRVLYEVLERQPELKAEWLRDHKLRCDPRITALGHFLRRTSLDELPQLWNVFVGDMSLVGPRPIVLDELLRYGRCAGIYLSAKPGITGLWQVTGRNNLNYRHRVALDVYYVKRQTLLLDMYILLKTTRVVLGGEGAY
jgi:exopolysaccharide production protein ExoY